jgi:hypothetical protein
MGETDVADDDLMYNVTPDPSESHCDHILRMTVCNESYKSKSVIIFFGRTCNAAEQSVENFWGRKCGPMMRYCKQGCFYHQLEH